METAALAMAALLLAIGSSEAQQPTKIPRIGYVSGTGSATNQGPYVDALRQGLRDLGYVEGRTFVIEYRGGEGKPNRYAALVNELVQLKVDVLVVPTLPAVLAAKKATQTIPIVMVSNRDPVANGIVDSLARPGGNITGLATLSQDLGGKRLELLTDTVPRLKRVGILGGPRGVSTVISFKEYELAARALKLEFQAIEVESENLDLPGAFQSAVKGGVSAIVTITTSLLFPRQNQIAELTIKNRLPSLFEGSTWVDSGGLMSYSTDDVAVYRRASTYIDKILKGAKPANLPIEQPTKFELVINLKTAKQIGLTILPNVLARADRVVR
jgi:putative tryptophan/tyrosine transport system substrate-binding protein